MPLDKILGDFLSAPTSGKMNLGGLLKNKKARRFLRKNGLGIGGGAAMAGVGFLAYQEWQKSQGTASSGAPSTGSTPPPLPGEPAVQPGGGTPPPLPTDLPPTPTAANRDRHAMNLVKAMIGAAHADGSVDQDELNAILGSLENGDLTASEKAELTAALNVPPTVEDIASLAANEEEGAEIYAASLSAIDADTPAESIYLARLAKQLSLPPDLVMALQGAASE